MGKQATMRRFAKWHIWIGWLVGVPILMWMLSGLVMVLKPIEEVRGEDLRLPVAAQPLPADMEFSIALPPGADRPVRSITTMRQGGRVITQIAYIDGTFERYRADGSRLSPLTGNEARRLVATRIKGGDEVESITRFDADEVPKDFRRPVPVWQVALTDGTHVYVGVDSGEIEAVRTRWWRFYDFMWGLHIMDLQTREDTHHPIIILFAILGSLGALLGCILMFRRRKAKPQ